MQIIITIYGIFFLHTLLFLLLFTAFTYTIMDFLAEALVSIKNFIQFFDLSSYFIISYTKNLSVF